MRTKNDCISSRNPKKPRALNLQLHSRVYLTSYVRYLCRTKSHLCRSQNKLLIIEIRRISRRYVNGLHTVGEACRECRRTCSFWRRTRRILSYVMQFANAVVIALEQYYHRCVEKRGKCTVPSFNQINSEFINFLVLSVVFQQRHKIHSNILKI